MKNQVAPLAGACKNYEEDLVLYYYGESAASERATVEQHMTQCGRCRNFVDDLGRVLPQMAPQPQLSQAFWDGYLSEIRSKLAAHDERQSWWRAWLAPLQGWLVPAFGTAAVTVFALTLLLQKSDQAPFNNPPSRNIPAAVLVDSNQLEFFKSLEILESLSTLEELERSKPEPKTSDLHNGRAAPAVA